MMGKISIRRGVGWVAVAAALFGGCSNPADPDGGGGGGSSGYTLNVSANPSSGGSVTRSPNKSSYSSGEQVTVTATPYTGYEFTGWSGSSTSASRSITVTMYSSMSLTANFSQPANAVVITLTSLATSVTDAGGIDPRVHFIVTSYRSGSRISSNTTGYLLDAQDINQPWSGYKESSPVAIATQADQVRIDAVVVEKDLLFDDDISPGYYVSFDHPVVGRSGSTTLDYGSGKSRVGFSYRFIWQ